MKFVNQHSGAHGGALVLAQNFMRALHEPLASIAVAQQLGNRQFKRIDIAHQQKLVPQDFARRAQLYFSQ